VPPRVDAETRYRRALYELEAAEQDFEAQVALERARQAVAVRQRAAAEAARLQRVNALYAEIERIKRARALQVQVEEEFGQRQRSFRAPTAFDHANRGERALLRALMNDGAEGVPAHAGFDHAHRGGHPLLRALVGDDAEGAPVQVAFDRAHRGGRGLLRALVHDEAEGVRVPRFFQGRRTCSQRIPSPTRQDNGPLTLGDLLGLIEGHLEPQPTGAPERPTSGSPSQADQPTEPQTQSARAKPIDAEATLGDMLEFFHSFAAKAQGGAGAEQSTHERGTASQREGAPVDGKGKAKAQPAPEPTLFEVLRERVNGARDQELRDVEYAIKLSLQDRDAGDVKKAQASKASQSTSSASSSKVKVEDRSSLGHAASHNPISTSVPTAASRPVSPLTAIRALRTQFSGLESAFKFPPVLDFDHSELAVTSNNASVRTYEHALNGILERLDTIESDGDEEVRDVRREVVREVERALEDVERKVKERTPQALVPEAAAKEEVEGYDVEREDPNVSATQDVPPVAVYTAEDAKATLLNVAGVVSQADAAIDLAISGEYQTASPVTESSEVAVAELNSSAKGETSTLSATDREAVPASEDISDSTATITPTPAATVASASASNTTTSTPPAAETFLTSMSHDQFTFPPRPAFSQSSTRPGVAHDDDAVLVDNSSEGSVRDDWTEFDA
jgi:hypothetical protein